MQKYGTAEWMRAQIAAKRAKLVSATAQMYAEDLAHEEELFAARAEMVLQREPYRPR